MQHYQAVESNQQGQTLEAKFSHLQQNKMLVWVSLFWWNRITHNIFWVLSTTGVERCILSVKIDWSIVQLLSLHYDRRQKCNSGSGETPLYVNVHMNTGDTMNTWIDALQAAFSGVQVCHNYFWLLKLPKPFLLFLSFSISVSIGFYCKIL